MTIKIPEKGLTRVERAKAEEALVEVLRILSHNNDLAQGAQIGTVDYASGLWRVKDLVEAALKPEESGQQGERMDLKATRNLPVILDTGVYVRAQDETGKWGSYDISLLTRESLIEYCREKDKVFLTALIGILLGHNVEGISEG